LKDDEKWALVHEYRRARLDGTVAAILCPDDGNQMVFVLGKKSNPALKCFECDVTFTPGLHVYKQMKEALNDRA
jgi:hypothetical protein